MSRPTVLIEVLLNGVWTDITGWVHLPSGIARHRGRDNEQGTADAGTLSFTVKNTTGRFTTGRPLLVDGSVNPFYPYFRRWAQIRYSVNGQRRYTGYISSAPTSWAGVSAALPDVRITCTDLNGMMRKSPAARSWASQLIGDLNPLYWWPMNDAVGSTKAAPAAGSLPMTAYRYVAGGGHSGFLNELVTFGVEGEDSIEADTQVTLKSTGTGLSLQNGNFDAALPSALPLPFTLILTLTANQLPKTGTIFMIDNSGLQLSWARGTMTLSEGASSTDFDSSLIISSGKASIIAVCVTSTTVTLLYPSASGVAGISITRPTPGLTLSQHVYLGIDTIEDAEFTYSNVAILPYLLSSSQYGSLVAKMLGEGTSSLSDWLNRALDVAGVTQPISLTYDRQMQRPVLKGSNPAAVGDLFSASCGGMFVADVNGNPYWIDPTYCPATVEIDAGDLQPGLVRDSDDQLYYTDVEVNGTTAASVAGFPRSARSIEGLLPDAALARYVQWLANTADVWGSERLTGLAVNLWPMDAGKVATYLSLDLRSRITLGNLPPAIPDPGVATIEGYDETITDQAWTLTFNTAPDPRFVLGDPVAGVLGSDYRLFWE